MNKNNLKRILPVFIFIFLLIPIITSSLLDLEKRKENNIAEQKILAEEQSKKETEQKIYLMGKFDPAERNDFILIPKQDTLGGNDIYLRQETLAAFLEMKEAAEKDGVILKIASATRNFDYQKNLWNNKWSGITLVDGKDLSKSIPDELERFKKILEYSAVPGMSRHHWGTDIDINNANPEYFEGESGEKVYNWLTLNASNFGFCQPYTAKGNIRKTGFSEEKWHWSYLPLAKNFTKEYQSLIKEKDINGFLGDKYVPEQNLINDYFLGINPDCL